VLQPLQLTQLQTGKEVINMSDFFINEELKDLNIQGKIFKYKPVTSGDELDWAVDYIEDIEETMDGKKFIKKRANLAKQAICKLRNIVAVPFTTLELEKVTGLKKKYSAYSTHEKDLLFRKINPDIYNLLIVAIDGINSQAKKD